MQDSLHSPFHHSVESLALSLDLSLSNSNYRLFSVWNSKSESSMENFVIAAKYLWNCVCSLISISRDSSRYERGTQRHDARSCDTVSIPPSLVESGDVGLRVTQCLWINNQYLIMASLQFFLSYSVWTETGWPWHPSWESTRVNPAWTLTTHPGGGKPRPPPQVLIIQTFILNFLLLQYNCPKYVQLFAILNPYSTFD